MRTTNHKRLAKLHRVCGCKWQELQQPDTRDQVLQRGAAHRSGQWYTDRTKKGAIFAYYVGSKSNHGLPVGPCRTTRGAILFTPDTILPGASGMRTILFNGVGTGKTALKLFYHRPWETDVAPEKLFYIPVVVNG